MAINNKRIKVSDLDFDEIKANLKTYLQGQDQFSDYDFEGSGLSILLDVLAYNTHYNAIYNNLAVNEMFLDSASKRSSVVSIAKGLGYLPRSATCATAVVNATVISPSSTYSTATLATLYAMQPWTTTVDNKSYTFYNTEDVTVTKTSGRFVFSNLTLVEGSPLSNRYTYTQGTRFIIPNSNCDLSRLVVQVQDNATSDVYYTYIRSDLTEVNSTSRTYFIKEIDDGLYEINFGDNVLGKALDYGNVVTISYFISSLDAPNKANTFTYNGEQVLGSNLSVVTVSAASGGDAPEDIASIKFNAPRIHAAQNRAVTTD